MPHPLLLLLGLSAQNDPPKPSIAPYSEVVRTANGALATFGRTKGGTLVAVRYDPATRRWARWTEADGAARGADCGQGLFVGTRAGGLLVGDVATGRTLRTIPGRGLFWRRVGGLLIGTQMKPQGKRFVLDARTGETVDGLVGEPLWDGPRRRLVLEYKPEGGLSARLTEMWPGALVPLRSVGVGRFERECNGLLGSPETGPVVLDFSTNGVGVESGHYEFVDDAFRLTPLTLRRCWGARGGWALGSHDEGYPAPRGGRYRDLFCVSVDGERTLWRVQFRPDEFLAAVWDDDRVRVVKKGGEVSLDPSTGRRLQVRTSPVPGETSALARASAYRAYRPLRVPLPSDAGHGPIAP